MTRLRAVLLAVCSGLDSFCDRHAAQTTTIARQTTHDVMRLTGVPALEGARVRRTLARAWRSGSLHEPVLRQRAIPLTALLQRYAQIELRLHERRVSAD